MARRVPRLRTKEPSPDKYHRRSISGFGDVILVDVNVPWCPTRLPCDPTDSAFAQQGVDVLIEAMHLLRLTGVTAHLYMIGQGSLKGFLERKICAYSLTDTVFLRENIPTATLRGYLQQCDCLVIPSRRDSIPLVFSEGLQAKIPMIVSATGDLATLVQKFDLGYVIPPGDPVQLKQALADFTRNRYPRKKESPAFDEAKALFSLSRATADFLHQVEKILHRSSASRAC